MSDSILIDLCALAVSIIVAGLTFYFNHENNIKIQKHNNKIQENNIRIQENNIKIQDLSQHREQSKLVPKVKGLKIKRLENNPTLAVEITNVGNYCARNLKFKIEQNKVTLCSVVDEVNDPMEIAPGGYYFFYTTIPWEYLNNDTYDVILTWEDDLTWDDEHGKRHSTTKVDIFGSYK